MLPGQAEEVQAGDIGDAAPVNYVPVTDDLQPYLAAAGHIVIMRADGQTFAHEHADVRDSSGRPVFALPGVDLAERAPDRPQAGAPRQRAHHRHCLADVHPHSGAEDIDGVGGDGDVHLAVEQDATPPPQRVVRQGQEHLLDIGSGREEWRTSAAIRSCSLFCCLLYIAPP